MSAMNVIAFGITGLVLGFGAWVLLAKRAGQDNAAASLLPSQARTAQVPTGPTVPTGNTQISVSNAPAPNQATAGPVSAPSPMLPVGAARATLATPDPWASATQEALKALPAAFTGLAQIATTEIKTSADLDLAKLRQAPAQQLAAAKISSNPEVSGKQYNPFSAAAQADYAAFNWEPPISNPVALGFEPNWYDAQAAAANAAAASLSAAGYDPSGASQPGGVGAATGYNLDDTGDGRTVYYDPNA